MRTVFISMSFGKPCVVPNAANIDDFEENGTPIPGFPDCFRAHIDGTVTKNSRALRGHMHRKGYRRITIRLNGKDRHYYVHSLIAAAFIGPRPEGFHVDHIDFNKLNNSLGNLRYLSAYENTRRRRAKS